MRYSLTSILFICCFFVDAQENYTTLTQKALQTMGKAEDEKDYKTALDMYEEAFKTFPDSISWLGLYKASVLASELKDYDKAFQYLIRLTSMKTNEGEAGWSYIVGNYAESEYRNLLSDTRWQALKINALKEKEQFYNALKDKENEFYSNFDSHLSEIKDAKTLFAEIKKYCPYKSKKDRDYSISFEINDSTKTSVFIHLPEHYNPQKKYPLLFFLHGAVKSNALTDYQLASWNLGGWNRYYTKFADKNEVILAFPKGSRQYNWMDPDVGFFMVPEMLKLIKSAINVDDKKVFISGHSNGATGSFSYLVKQPTPFAGFYGFNTQPKVFSGGTFIQNIKNRSFINFSTDKDYYYPPNANDDFTKLMNLIKADYKEYRYYGFPHWFPKFDESEPAYHILFSDLASRNRDLFPKEISWEFDDEKYGSVDWLSNAKLDTLISRANWHKGLNFKIDKWLAFGNDDSLISKIVDKNAFDFPRKSGKIKAAYSSNVFRIETSCITSFTINISPEMIDPQKKVKVYINKKLYFNKKVKYNREFMLENFENSKDREQVWMNCIELKL